MDKILLKGKGSILRSDKRKLLLKNSSDDFGSLTKILVILVANVASRIRNNEPPVILFKRKNNFKKWTKSSTNEKRRTCDFVKAESIEANCLVNPRPRRRISRFLSLIVSSFKLIKRPLF